MPSPRRQRLDLRALLRLRATRMVLLGGVLVGIALAISAALTLSHALSPEAFAAMAGEGFEREIHVERVQLELGRTVRLRIEGIQIEGLGSAAAAEIELRRRPLIHGKLRARVVRFEDPKIVLHRGPGGEFLPVFQPGEGGNLSDLPAFEAGGGEIRIVQGAKLTAVVRLKTLTLGRFDADHSAPLVLSGNATGGDGRWHTHPLQVRGRLVQTPERIELLDGFARARRVGAVWWSGRDARARFIYRDGRLEIASLDVRGFGGNWHVSGVAWLRGGMRLDLATRVDGVDFASLLSALDGRGPETDADLGTLRMRWDPLRVPWRGGPRFEEGNGVGHLRVTGGRLPGTSLLGSWVGLEPEPTPVESFSALTQLHDARLHSDALRLVTGDYTLEAQGSVGLDRTVALEGRLDLAGDLLLPKGATLLPTVPVTIGGLLPHPDIDAHVSRLPGGAVTGAVQKVGGVIGAAGRKVGGGLGAAGQKIGDALGR
ncbi:MAG: hypothetical protein JRG83_02720 [Deltaproteobacteria bacterium]|nr:hypothetical protein [Deltaproteobacteria bacterium]